MKQKTTYLAKYFKLVKALLLFAFLVTGFGAMAQTQIDVTSGISKEDQDKVIAWIRSGVEINRVSYCYRNSNGRGAGEMRSTCPTDKVKENALCYVQCPEGYGSDGALMCYKYCPSGFRDDGLYCAKGDAYGNGIGTIPSNVSCPSGYWQRGVGAAAWCDNRATWLWDLKTCSAVINCGGGKTMVVGLCYNNCRTGYSFAGGNVCSPNCPTGFTDIGVSCTKPSKSRAVGTPMTCKTGTVPDETGGPVGLCYPACGASYHGVGPVCWQNCPAGLVECGAGCAASAGDCASTTFDQVFSVAVLAANLATMGAAKGATAGAKVGVNAVQVGDKVISYTSKVGEMAAKTVAKLQTIEKAASTATETVTLSKKVIKNGQEVIEKIQMAKEAYETIDSYANLYSENFAGQTTSEINTTINAKFNPAQAKAIKKAWAQVAVSELAYANGITMAQNAMSVMSLVGMVDPIGLTDVVAAYTHPVCAAGNPFPALSKNYKQ